jgi:hypothetical protein
MHFFAHYRPPRAWLLYLALAVTACIYWPGVHGGWLFDDYPNIVDNRGVQPEHASIPSLTRAAFSSPSSEFKRPLSSLTFAANYLATGLDPFWMKVTNLLIHLLNGLLVYALSRRLIRLSRHETFSAKDEIRLASLIAAAWLLLPINLTGVLYVVQRMESLANLFVLAGLLGYVSGRQKMLAGDFKQGLVHAAGSLIVATGIGLTAKETAAMLPLYAALTEWILFGFRTSHGGPSRSILALFGLTLVLPLLAGLAWLLPGVFRPENWATRDFTLTGRLLSEARIVTDYISWTLLPTPQDLSFYHDDFRVSSSLLTPWTTLPSMLLLACLAYQAWRWRKRRPLAALGLSLYLGCHLLTGTILPLELIYEHRNYFASFGLLLAIVPALTATPSPEGPPAFALARRTLLGVLFVWWMLLTAMTAQAWGNPLSLAEELATRAPESPRAQYELGRTYIIYSHYDPESRFTQLAYAPLERAMKLPDSSILPEQALIFMNSRMHLPMRDTWWDSMVKKLQAEPPGVQDESSLAALAQCARERRCDLPHARMVEAFHAALAHPKPSARLLATYGDYAWNVLMNRELGTQMTLDASKAAPNEPAYHITLARMYLAQHDFALAKQQIDALQALDIGGRLDNVLPSLLDELRAGWDAAPDHVD